LSSVTIGPDQNVEEARRLMAQHHPDRVLVVQDDRLVGIVSEADIPSEEAPGGLSRMPAAVRGRDAQDPGPSLAITPCLSRGEA
jgi:CBS-domain-containing membrane protein